MKSINALLVVLGLAGAALAAAPEDYWPQWRGPNREGHSPSVGLLKSWPADGPQVLWESDQVGVGYSSLSIADGVIYTQGDLDGVEHILALDGRTGKVIWAVQPEPVRKALAERVQEQFKRLDADNNGNIDEGEALSRLGWNNLRKYDQKVAGDPERIAVTRAANLVLQLDQDGDGKLSYQETNRQFDRDFANIDREDKAADADQMATQRAKQYFQELDANTDGKLDRKEIRGTFLDRVRGQVDKRPSGEKKGDELLTQEEIVAYLTRFQPGMDGLLTADELAQYFAKAAPGQDGKLTAAEVTSIYGGYRNGMGDGPRGTPTIEDDRLYAEGGNGDLTCLNRKTGETIWHVNLTELGGRRPGWGYSESPLIVGKLLIVTPGGKEGTVAALDKMTGKVVWRSTELTESAHYASPVFAEIHGVPQIVQFARESCFGVTLDGGKLLWQYKNANNGTANCCTPIVHKNHVFASSAYGTGGGLAKISPADDRQQAEEVYFEKKMANHHGGIVRVGDHMYGFGSGGLICMNVLTGEIAWTARSVGKGSLCYADGMLYLLGERHEVAIAEATPEEYREHGRFKIENLGRPSWAHPVVAGGVFYIRNQNKLTAYDVKARQ